MVGNAFIQCTAVVIIDKNPCTPSPCGPNSRCREYNGQAVCSCIEGFIGTPPTCRPECTVSSDCSLHRACSNQKCIDPCPGTCGINAKCQVINHSPICSCISGFTGDAFSRCHIIRKYFNIFYILTIFPNYNLIIFQLFVAAAPTEIVPINPCIPSPCGPNALCHQKGEIPSCSCLPDFIGTPPNCRPECVANDDCVNNLACINKKCKDPCPGSCASNAYCSVVSHTPRCSCPPGYTGNALYQCIQLEGCTN